MELPVHNHSGKVVDKVEVSDFVFGVPFNNAVVHQAMVSQQANARQGTADSKTRGEVAGSTKKLFAQKHTGNARAGSIKSPLRRGGGIVFGPHPRDYRQSLPKKMRRLAIRCLLSSKVKEGDLVAIEELNFPEPSTREMAGILSALGVDSTALVVTPASEVNIIKSTRNIPGIEIMPADLLNVVSLLHHKKLIITVEAVRKANELWGEKPAGVSNAAV